MTIQYFTPQEGINSEEYRTELVATIHKLETQLAEYEKDYAEGQSFLPYFIAIAGVITIYISLSSYESEATNFLGVIGLGAIVYAIFQFYNNKDKLRRGEHMSASVRKDLAEARDCYNYAYKHRDRDGSLIYEDDGLRGKKIYE